MRILEHKRRLIAGVALLVVLAAIAFSARDMYRYAGFDLRPKVLGARALLLGLDPYLPETLRWTSETPPTLIDPETVFYAGTGLSRVTYPPTLLLIYMPFADLPYPVQRAIWGMLEWAAMLGAIAALAASIREPRARFAFVIVAAVFFCGSPFWRWHVERGQYYVFLVLLLSLDLMALRRVILSGRPGWLGVPTGVAVAVRPTLVILLPLLWLMGERRAAMVGTAVAAALMAATLPFAGIAEWRHYFANAALMADQVAGIGQAFLSVELEAPPGASYLFEGYNFWHGLQLPYPRHNLAVCGLFPSPWCLPASKALAAVVPLAAAGAMYWLRAARAHRDLLLLVLMAAPVLLDYAVPMRWSYVDVMFLPMLAILMPAVVARPVSLAAGLVGAALLTCLPLIDGWHVSALRQALFLGAAAAGAAALYRSARMATVRSG